MYNKGFISRILAQTQQTASKVQKKHVLIHNMPYVAATRMKVSLSEIIRADHSYCKAFERATLPWQYPPEGLVGLPEPLQSQDV